MKKIVFPICVFFVILFASCESKEEKAIEQLLNQLDEPQQLKNQMDEAEKSQIEYVLVEGGTFKKGRESTTVDSFYMCVHEVTQKEYYVVMEKNPSKYKYDGLPVDNSPTKSWYDYLPVENVNWYDTLEYCNALSEQEGLTPCYTINGPFAKCNFNASGYRLPTEAEWEYAARGGNKSYGYNYSGSNSLGNVAWYSKNSGGIPHVVKTKVPNELGIYDMSGNVAEWCWDSTFLGTSRRNRGGDYATFVSHNRVDKSFDTFSWAKLSTLGFRVVRSAQ